MTGITIFTPTYNRAALLDRAYESLTSQDCRDFEWLIIDDGSTDDTKKVVERYIAEAGFPVRYFYQENSGKHIAQNHAVDMAEGELFLCLDSDDRLADVHTISSILEDWKKAAGIDRCAGMISYKAEEDGRLFGEAFPDDIEACSPVELKDKYRSSGERNYIVLTTVLKENKYPQYEGEKFCPDSFVVDKLSYTYKMMLRPVADEICEYQEDGLSAHFKSLMKDNPKGFCISNMQLIDVSTSLKNRMSAAKYYWAFRIYDGNDIPYSGEHKLLVGLMSIPGALYALYYRCILLR